MVEKTVTCFVINKMCSVFMKHFATRLKKVIFGRIESNSSLWIDVVRLMLTFKFLFNLCVEVLEFALQSGIPS